MEQISIAEAQQLIEHSLQAVGIAEADSRIAADHLIDCELRGLGYGGLARTLTVVERIRGTSEPAKAMRVLKESPISATIDGGDQLGYLVAQRATEMAIAKAKASGIAVVAANNTWYTGMYSWYLEQVAAAGYFGMVAGNGGRNVAPHGSSEAMFGTNPIAFGFPTDDEPMIWDTGTSAITHAEVVLAGRLGVPLPEGIAFGPDGSPTLSAEEALQGAFAVWGGHRGSGLSMTVHLLGMMTGAPAWPNGRSVADLGFFLLVIDPEVLTDAGDFRKRAGDFLREIRSSRPATGGGSVRIPFDRSRETRRETLARGTIEVDDAVLQGLRDIVASRS